MKERFLDIEKKIGQKIDEFMRITLDYPRSYEEVSSDFRHGKNCSQTQPLNPIETEEYINFHDGGGWGVNISSVKVERRYLECPECHASERYLQI